MPPSHDELAAYQEQLSKDPATARVAAVDRLLASPHLGERWAAVWLDLARYSDTYGFEKDPGRDIWPFRDWVIRAFNADMPYDEFTIDNSPAIFSLTPPPTNASPPRSTATPRPTPKAGPMTRSSASPP